MSLGLYMDVHVPAAITRALRRHGSDVLTAQEDGSARLSDPDLLDRAENLSRIVFTRDSDFLAEGVRRQRASLSFATIVFAHQQNASISRCIEDLSMILEASTLEEAVGQIVYIPL